MGGTVSSQKMSSSPHPCYLWLWLYGESGSLQMSSSSYSIRPGSEPVMLSLWEERRLDIGTDTQGECHMASKMGDVLPRAATPRIPRNHQKLERQGKILMSWHDAIDTLNSRHLWHASKTEGMFVLSFFFFSFSPISVVLSHILGSFIAAALGN